MPTTQQKPTTSVGENNWAMQRCFQLLKTVDHPEHIPAIVALVTECYLSSPIFQYMFGGEVRKGLDWLNGRRLTDAGDDSIFWLDEQGRVQGHLILRLTPERVELKGDQKEAKDARDRAEWAAVLDSDCWRRRQLAFKGFFGSVKRALATQPAGDIVWSLSMLAVHPRAQGKGVGSGVLRQLFTELVEPSAAAGQARVDCMSQMERNLGLYARLGFETVEHVLLVDEADQQMNIPNWVLSKTFSNTTSSR